MLSTTQHMPLAIRLSPASRYLRPSSYLRHALLLGFSSFLSPPPPHTHTQQCLSSSISLLISFCSRKSLCFFFGHPALSVLLPVARGVLVSICRLISPGRRRGSSLLIITVFLAVSLLPHKSLSFCPSLSASLPLSLWAARLIRNILKITVHSLNHEKLPFLPHSPIERDASGSFPPNEFNRVLCKIWDLIDQGE